jgi:SAM-dependent methyltransferase
MSLSMDVWHARFAQQAGWSHTLRQHLLGMAGLPGRARVLEVGCGTGAVLEGLPPGHSPVGIDIDLARLHYAAGRLPAVYLCAADAHRLPLPSSAFDAAFCHYLLLWLRRPAEALSEMRRVTRPGGWVFAFSEPDYGGRIDRPDALQALGEAQAESLAAQGADTRMGRGLPALFAAVGFDAVQWGVLAAERRSPPNPAETDLEWAILRADLAGRFSPEALGELEALDRRSSASGERVLFIPTFYAAGRVP